MAYIDQIMAMQATVYAQRGVPALWIGFWGSVPVTLLADQGDGIDNIPQLGRTVTGRNVFRLRVAEVAVFIGSNFDPSYGPKRNDNIQLEPDATCPPELLTIVNSPTRSDRLQLEWKLECS